MHKLRNASVGVTLLALVVGAGCFTPSSMMVEPDYVADCTGDNGPAPESIRMVTYNIKSGSESSLEQIGDVLEELDADIITLQEVDYLAPRSGSVDQAGFLAERLGMHYAFAAAKKQGDGDYGVAMLSRLPFVSAKRVPLPDDKMAWEPRVALDAKVCVANQALRVVGLHADVYPWVADRHAEFIAEEVRADVGNGVIVAGDFNQTPEGAGPQSLLKVGLSDPGPNVGTSSIEGRRIDYVFIDGLLKAMEANIHQTSASDHVPVFTDLVLTPKASEDVRTASAE
jgi:endonuclease/exonuclease/phosphatase family metal-dependent hydrolase